MYAMQSEGFLTSSKNSFIILLIDISILQINKMLVYALSISLFSYGLILAVQWLEGRIRNWKPV